MERKAVELGELWPGVTAALSFSAVDIMIKVVYASGMDVMTLVSLRGILVVGFMGIWLWMMPPAARHSSRQRLIALAIGILFGGTMFGLLKAISLLPVSVAILAYFAYPVLTGVAGAHGRGRDAAAEWPVNAAHSASSAKRESSRFIRGTSSVGGKG